MKKIEKNSKLISAALRWEKEKQKSDPSISALSRALKVTRQRLSSYASLKEHYGMKFVRKIKLRYGHSWNEIMELVEQDQPYPRHTPGLKASGKAGKKT